MEGELSNTMRKALFVLSCVSVAIGSCGGPMLLRLYFVRGGSRIWLTSWLQTVGWPVSLIPLLFLYLQRRKTHGANAELISMRFPVFIWSALLGIISGTINYSFAAGVQRLPVSTASLIISTQLIFTAFFALLLVRQKFTPYSVNTVVLLTLGSAVLALHASGDKPQGESNKTYALGFVMTIAASILTGLLFPLVELIYKKAKQAVTCTLVLEIQTVICFSATIFAVVGMLANNDFKAMPPEAREFQLGEAKYYVILFASALVWQFNMLGLIGIVFCASSLVSGIMTAVMLPFQEVLAVIIFHDKFQVEKGLSLVLCLWGFVSHFYGEYQAGKKMKNEEKESELTPAAIP